MPCQTFAFSAQSKVCSGEMPVGTLKCLSQILDMRKSSMTMLVMMLGVCVMSYTCLWDL